MNRRLARVAVSCLLLFAGCDEPTTSQTATSAAASTTVSAPATSSSLPAVDLLTEDQSRAILIDHFIIHIAPMVAPVGDVVLTVGTISGLPAPVDGVNVVIEAGGQQRRVAAELASGSWSTTVAVGAGGLRYRFELSTAHGVVALPADHEFVNLYAAASGSVDLGADSIEDLAPSRVQQFAIGVGDDELGRGPVPPGRY